MSVIGLMGCAQNPSPSATGKSASVQSAEQLERKASAAYEKGDTITAAKNFQTASDVYQSLAMIDAFALAQLSLARIDSEDGRTVQALARINYILRQANQGALIASSTLLLANGRAAALYLQLHDWSAADGALITAETLCGNTCPAAVALMSLRAQWYLSSGDAASAKNMATQASTSATTPVDKANALRDLAQSNLALGYLDQAVVNSTQALSVDQSLGLAKRVIADLDLLSKIYTQAANFPKANDYQDLSRSAQMALTRLSGK